MDQAAFGAFSAHHPARYPSRSHFINPVCGHVDCIYTVSHHHCSQCGYGSTEVDQQKGHRCQRPYGSEYHPPPPPPPPCAFYQPPHAPPGAAFYPPPPPHALRPDDRPDYGGDFAGGHPFFAPAPMLGAPPMQYFAPPPPGAPASFYHPVYRPVDPLLPAPAAAAAPLDFSDRRAASPTSSGSALAHPPQQLPAYPQQSSHPRQLSTAQSADRQSADCQSADAAARSERLQPPRGSEAGCQPAGKQEPSTAGVAEPAASSSLRLSEDTSMKHQQAAVTSERQQTTRPVSSALYSSPIWLPTAPAQTSDTSRNHDNVAAASFSGVGAAATSAQERLSCMAWGGGDTLTAGEFSAASGIWLSPAARTAATAAAAGDAGRPSCQLQERLLPPQLSAETGLRLITTETGHITAAGSSRPGATVTTDPLPSSAALSSPIFTAIAGSSAGGQRQLTHSTKLTEETHSKLTQQPTLEQRPTVDEFAQASFSTERNSSAEQLDLMPHAAGGGRERAGLELRDGRLDASKDTPALGDEVEREPETIVVTTEEESEERVHSPAGLPSPERVDSPSSMSRLPSPERVDSPSSMSGLPSPERVDSPSSMSGLPSPERVDSPSSPASEAATAASPSDQERPQDGTATARRPSSGEDTSLSPINVDIQVNCLICSTLINLQTDQYCDIYLDNIVTAHSRLPVSEKLGIVLRYHFSPELLHSHTLCRRCFNIINGIDQLEGRLDKLRSEVRHKFTITCSDRNLSADHFPPLDPDVDADAPAVAAAAASGQSPVSASLLPRSTQTSPIPEPWRCHICETTFRYRSDLSRHVASRHGERRRAVSCGKCARVFVSGDSLRRHVRRAHAQLVKCRLCRASFESREQLVAHVCVARAALRSVENLSDRTCNLCDRVFTEKKNLTAHKKYCGDDTVFKCESCGVAVVGKAHYEKHVQLHEQKHPHSCPTCKKGFHKPSDLKRHIRTHDKLKSHVCETCGKQFSTTSNYNQHMAKVHAGHRSFKCSLCPKSFSYKSSLEVHTASHQGVKTLKCDQCDKAFLYKNNLVRHVRLHGVAAKYKCDHCDRNFSTKSALKNHSVGCF